MPRETGWLQQPLRRVLKPVIHRLWDLDITGLDNIPAVGPALLAPNHLSFLDSPFTMSLMPRRTLAVGKAEYMDDWKTKYIFPAFGMIPVDRSGGEAAQAALDTAARVLDGGHLFMIYPEGTRSRSGNLHKARTGAARLSVRCDAPIIPVGHIGTLDVQPPDQFKMKPGLPVTVRFGEPMHISEFGDPNDPRSVRPFADAVMYEIAQLSGQKYVDTYAGSEDKDDEQPKVETPVIAIPPGRARAPKLVSAAAS